MNQRMESNEDKAKNSFEITPMDLINLGVNRACAVVLAYKHSYEEAGHPEVGEQIEHAFLNFLKDELIPWLNMNHALLESLCQKINNLVKQTSDFVKLDDSHWQLVHESIQYLKQEGMIPQDTDILELIGNIIDIASTQPFPTIPPNHSLLLMFGVSNEGEWSRLSPSSQLIRFLETYSDQSNKKPWVQKTISLLARWAKNRSRLSVSSERIIGHEAVLQNIEARQDKLQERLSHDEIVELLRKEGINKNDLTDKMWRLIFQLYDAFNEGAEIGSKKGLSLHAYFGEDSATTRKQLSRLREKATKLKAKKT